MSLVRFHSIFGRISKRTQLRDPDSLYMVRIGEPHTTGRPAGWIRARLGLSDPARQLRCYGD